MAGRRSLLKGFSKEDVEDLYLRQNMTDREIGQLKGVTDAAVSYFRRKMGIPTRTQLDRNTFDHQGPSFNDATPDDFISAYAAMGLRGVAKLYGVSKPTVAQKLRLLGIPIISKTERSTSREEISEAQKELIIGSLLGDGFLAERGVFKVSHYQEQIGYLLHTRKALEPLALPTYYEEKEMENGRLTFTFGYRTVQHEWLKKLRGTFYPKGEKIFPEEILKSLSARSLAYWYFDDGHLDGLSAIALGKISLDMAQMVAQTVSQRFGITAYVLENGEVCRLLRFRASSTDRFFELIRDYASVDMLYKLPAKHWPLGVVAPVPSKTKDPYLLSKSLIEEAKGWLSAPKDDQDIILESFAQFWEKTGFPHHIPRPEELTSLIHLDPSHVIQENIIKPRQVGQAICQGLNTHIWDSNSEGGESPQALFKNPLRLREVLRFCLSSGDIPNASKLRGALRFWRRSGVYNFRPSAAKALVDLYCPPGGTVLDPCAGYGGRLLGSLLSKASPRYLGWEPSTETLNGLHKLYRWIYAYLPQLEGKAELHHQPAEEGSFPLASVDMVLTSPPYWKREHYSDEDTQSASRYPTYHGWLHGFWRPVVKKSIEALRPGGWLILNVDDFKLNGVDYPLIKDTVAIVASLGLGKPQRLDYDLPGVGSGCEAVLLWPKGQSVVQDLYAGARLNVSACSLCGASTPETSLHKGLCVGCLKPVPDVPLVKCAGCDTSFAARSKLQRYHDDACRARHLRRLVREANPLTGIRTFTCKTCLKTWQTEAKGHFNACPSCRESLREQKELESRQKTCVYRHCGLSFVDTSLKNSMSYCCPEHRRREKLFRSGAVESESSFRKEDPRSPSKLLM
jgi:hypothetical protein